MVEDPLDDSDPTFRGPVYALVIIVLICSLVLAVTLVLGFK